MMSGLLPPLSSRTSGGVSPYLLLLRVRGLPRRAGRHRLWHELPRVIRFVTAWGPGLVRENVTRPGPFACTRVVGACSGGVRLVPADARCQKRQQGNPGREHVRRAVRRDDEPDGWQAAPVDAHVGRETCTWAL